MKKVKLKKSSVKEICKLNSSVAVGYTKWHIYALENQPRKIHNCRATTLIHTLLYEPHKKKKNQVKLALKIRHRITGTQQSSTIIEQSIHNLAKKEPVKSSLEDELDLCDLQQKLLLHLHNTSCW